MSDDDMGFITGAKKKTSEVKEYLLNIKILKN
jgi:hypothetical protein